MKGLYFLSLFIFFVSSSFAKVIDHKVTLKKMDIFSIKEACLALGHTDLLMSERKDRGHINCMGTIEKASEFCLKKLPFDTTLARGYVDEKSNQIICEKGENIIVKVACDKRDVSYCKNPKLGCEELQKIFALKHIVFRSTLGDYLTGKALNCYFTTAKTEIEGLQDLNTPLIQ